MERGAEGVAIVAGATGLVGRELVRQLAGDPAWGEVRALARRELPADLTGLRLAPIRVDYARLHPPPSWAEADHVFCALGTTMRQAGSREAFRRVDHDYVIALARAVLARGARHFLLVSAVGAASGSPFFYNRVKGDVEAAVSALGFRSVTIARPSLLLGGRAEFRLGEQVGKVLGLFTPPRWRPVPAERVAAALVRAAREDRAGLRVLENRDLSAG